MIVLASESARSEEDADTPVLAVIRYDGVGAGRRRVVEVVDSVARHEEVKAPVAIVVSEGGAGGPASKRDSRLLSNIGEGPVVIVMVETIFSQVGDIQVGPAIVVVVAHSDSDAPSVVRHTRFCCDIRKRAVVVVM